MLRLAVDTNRLMSWRKELGLVLEQEVRKPWEVLCIRWRRNRVFRFGWGTAGGFSDRNCGKIEWSVKYFLLSFCPSYSLSCFFSVFLFSSEVGSDIVQDSYKFATVSEVTWFCDHPDPSAFAVHIPCHGPPHWTLSPPSPACSCTVPRELISMQHPCSSTHPAGPGHS